MMCASVAQCRVVVGVDDARAGRDVLRDLVGVAGRGHARADAGELGDSCLAGQVPDGPGEEVTLGAGDFDDGWEDGADLVTYGAVGWVVAVAA